MASAQLTSRARRELGEATRWISRESPKAARGLRRAVVNAARLLGEHPSAGALRPDIAGERYRFLVLTGYPYILIYDAEHRPPVITRIVHGARDLPELLRDL